MHLARHLQRLPKTSTFQRNICNSSTILASSSETCHNSLKNEENVGLSIEIPNRIHRSSTDILMALSSTVGRDPSAAHYKYHDDPFLIPTSNVGKRTFAMAQESGRKAALWIKEKHRDLFMHQEAQPAIKEFAPKMIFNEQSQVEESNLQDLIAQGELTDAVCVYNLMKQNGMEISMEMKQSLLELVCFYNNEEPLPEEFIEERWFKQSTGLRERSRKTWKDGELAEQLFAEIEPKTANTYSTLIRGMTKYCQAERGYALLQEAIEKQFELDTTTFNSIINISNLLRETADQRWDLCTEIMQQMAQQQIKPNLDTMNALLESISSFGNYKLARSTSLRVLAEFKKLDIKPSLGTYYYILIIFCRERAPVSHVIVDILREIEGQEFTIQHVKDTYFFATAMDVCRNHLHDKSLAKKVDALLHTGKNFDLIGDSYKESIYYRHFFALLCQTESIEEFMKTYDLLVPNVYIPEPGIMEELLKAVDINGAVELVPRLWSDMLIFDHNRDSLITRTLKIMIDHKQKLSKSPELAQQFAKVALDIYNKVNDSETRVRKIAFTGHMIGDILTLLVRGDNFEKALEVFTVIDKNQHRIPGTPSELCMSEWVEACIVNKTPTPALLCLQYAVENNMESESLARKIKTGFTLSEVHLSKLHSLVGENILAER